MKLLIQGLAALTASVLVRGVQVPPTALDASKNLVLFPNRDFITVEGFQGYVGRKFRVSAWRGNLLIGGAEGTGVAGDVLGEVNHPGGLCWGQGFGPKVTPDLVAGDRVEIAILSANPAVSIPEFTADATIIGAEATTVSTPNALTLVVEGVLQQPLDADQGIEQRCVVPELKDTAVGRRDVRAVRELTIELNQDTQEEVYQSQLVIDGLKFKATYTFTPGNEELAGQIAAAGGARVLTWHDVGGERIGITIAELGELGGPGFGGCPVGPGDVAASGPGEATVTRIGAATTMTVEWTAAQALPAAAKLIGYEVSAIAPADPAGVSKMLGVRTGEKTLRATISGLDPAAAYTVEVRGLDENQKLSAPLTRSAAGVATAPPGQAVIRPEPLAFTFDKTANRISLSNSASDVQVYYTLNGIDPIVGDIVDMDAKLFEGSLVVAAEVGSTIDFRARGISDIGLLSDTFVSNTAFVAGANTDAETPPLPPAVPQPAAPTLTAAPGSGSVIITAAPAVGTVRLRMKEVDNTVDPLPEYIDGKILTTGTVFTVATTKARTFIVDASKDTTGNNWGDASLKITATPGRVVDRVVVSLVRWRAGDFRFEGTQSGAPGASAPTIKVWLGTAAQYAKFKAAPVTPTATSDEVGTQLSATTTLTTAVPPAVGFDWSTRIRTNTIGVRAPTPLVWAVSTNGGISDSVSTGAARRALI